MEHMLDVNSENSGEMHRRANLQWPRSKPSGEHIADSGSKTVVEQRIPRPGVFPHSAAFFELLGLWFFPLSCLR